VALGERLYERQILPPLRGAQVTAAEMVRRVRPEMDAAAGRVPGG
jgi:hypothetical protein